jgi:predicted NBD/HSP70 family sugar kinase
MTVEASGAGAVLQAIRSTGCATRAELAEATGLSRSTLAERLEVLMGSTLIRPGDAMPSDGGRPRSTVELNPSAGVLLVADVEATRTVLAVLDLAAATLGEATDAIAVADGPSAALEAIDLGFERLLRVAGRRSEEVRGVGIAVPSPVAFATGRPVRPPLMPGWHEFPIREWFADRYEATVIVDNDVNAMAFGEQQTWYGECEQLLFVKIGAGIGCGISSMGQILRGADGAAGDIGHMRVTGRDDVRCSCGNRGCLEAVAGTAAIVGQLAEAGHDATGAADIVRLVQAADPLANRLVRESGRCLGEVLARCVSFFNPGAIVIGGPLMEAPQPLLAGVREVTIARTPPLATSHLRIVASRLGERAGIVGTGLLLCEHVFAPAAIDDVLARTAIVQKEI